MCQAPAAASPTLTRAEREAMLARVEPCLRKVVKQRVRPNQVEDVMQDVRLAVWLKTEAYDPARGVPWTTYATGIAKNHCAKHLTDNYHDPIAAAQMVATKDNAKYLDDQCGGQNVEAEVDDREPDAEREAEELGGEAVRAVRATAAEPLLAALSPMARAVITPIVLDGLSPAQVADQVGRSVKDVKLFIRNAARSLGGRFAEAGQALGIVPRVRERGAQNIARGHKQKRFEAAAVAALAEVGPDAKGIATRFGVGVETLLRWPAFRTAYDAAKAGRSSPTVRPVSAALAPPAPVAENESALIGLVRDVPRTGAGKPERKTPVRDAKEPLAIAALAEHGPNAEQIATAVGVSSGGYLFRWPAFRAAYEQARAAEASKRAECIGKAATLVREGQSIRQAAAEVGIDKAVLGTDPGLRVAFEESRTASKRERHEAAAVAMLAEVGPDKKAIAARLGVSPTWLGEWRTFREAYDRARLAAGIATITAGQARQEPTPVARTLSGHGWHFGKRLVPGSAKSNLNRRDRRAAKR